MPSLALNQVEFRSSQLSRAESGSSDSSGSSRHSQTAPRVIVCRSESDCRKHRKLMIIRGKERLCPQMRTDLPEWGGVLNCSRVSKVINSVFESSRCMSISETLAKALRRTFFYFQTCFRRESVATCCCRLLFRFMKKRGIVSKEKIF